MDGLDWNTFAAQRRGRSRTAVVNDKHNLAIKYKLILISDSDAYLFIYFCISVFLFFCISDQSFNFFVGFYLFQCVSIYLSTYSSIKSVRQYRHHSIRAINE